MKLSILIFMAIAFATTTCAQQQEKTNQPISQQPVAEQKFKMSVDGMVCSACQSAVKKTIKSFDGVTNVEVSLEKRIAFITFNPLKVKPEQIQKAVNDKGYTAGKPQDIKQ